MNFIYKQKKKSCEQDLCSTETRIVKCSDINGICDPTQRPKSERKCKLPSNIECGKWVHSNWSNVIIYL